MFKEGNEQTENTVKVPSVNPTFHISAHLPLGDTGKRLLKEYNCY